MRYIVGILIAIGLVVLVIVVAIKLIFGGGKKTNVSPIQLTNYANTNVTMQMTIQGTVVADQNYREIRINIGQNQSNIVVIQGYQNNVINNKTFANNESAYYTFLRSLQAAGFTHGNPDPALANEQGYCSLGNRTIYEIVQGDQDIQRYWSTTCIGTRTFEGRSSTVRSLFIRQIPGYGRIVNGVNLSG